MDAEGRRQGEGRMDYEDGGSYEGPFRDDKFHRDKGTYRWEDGDEYSGSWNPCLSMSFPPQAR